MVLKEKGILSISIGCAAFILTMVMFTQFKTIEYTDIVAMETMRETELRAKLAEWKEKYAEVETKLMDTNAKIAEYKSQMSSEQDATNLLRQEVEEARKYLGNTDVRGEGIIVTLEDSSKKEIERLDLINLINELKIAGAEAISINDERIVSVSDVASINYGMILINGRRTSTPYIVKAIGDRKHLESAITIKGGFLDEMRKVEEKTVGYSVEENIVITKYQGEMPLEYMKKEEKK